MASTKFGCVKPRCDEEATRARRVLVTDEQRRSMIPREDGVDEMSELLWVLSSARHDRGHRYEYIWFSYLAERPLSYVECMDRAWKGQASRGNGKLEAMLPAIKSCMLWVCGRYALYDSLCLALGAHVVVTTYRRYIDNQATAEHFHYIPRSAAPATSALVPKKAWILNHE